MSNLVNTFSFVSPTHRLGAAGRGWLIFATRTNAKDVKGSLKWTAWKEDDDLTPKWKIGKVKYFFA